MGEQWKVAAGYPPASPGYGENILWGASSVREAFQIWVDSPAHYQNMVSPNYTEVGVGIASGVYWGVYTLHFGNARTASCGGNTTPVPPASTGSSRTTDNVNLRASSSLSGTVLAVLPTNTLVTLLGPSQTANGYTWVNVSANGIKGWIASDFLSTGTTIPTPTKTSTSVPTRTSTPTKTSTVIPTSYLTTSMNFRSSPSLSGTIIRVLPTGTAYKKLGPTQVADGYQWINISVQGQRGWIANLATTVPSSSLTPTRTSTPIPTLTEVTGVSTNSSVNLRSQATINSAVITVLAEDTSVTVLGGSVFANGYEWTEVIARGMQGWIATEFLDGYISSAEVRVDVVEEAVVVEETPTEEITDEPIIIDEPEEEITDEPEATPVVLT